MLAAEVRERFFDHLLAVADRFRDETQAVLRRQATYLLGFDEREPTRQWLRDEQRAALRAVPASRPGRTATPASTGRPAGRAGAGRA